jgi:ABC-type multidrug transport system fused ATPase/permease subunit
MQDNLLLSGSILDNIRFGRPTSSDEEVREAARHASALEFIEELPEGFATKVGERGVSLSGGQRQRIAIARALLRNPKILILDEATSALDYESEKSVQAAIDYLAKDRTTITIAHRLSTIRGADRIIVLKAGECISEGSWAELAAQDGAFKDLLDAQT